MPWNTGLQGTPLNIAAYPGTQLRVLVGPGTGKTFALMRRVARLLDRLSALFPRTTRSALNAVDGMCQ